MQGTQAVEAYLERLDGDRRAIMAGLRALALEAAEGVTEHIKWNAPSFRIHGDDRITLGIAKDGCIRVVLHRGAKPGQADGFAFDDPGGRIEWAAQDRGIMTFAGASEVEADAPALRALFGAWFAATA